MRRIRRALYSTSLRLRASFYEVDVQLPEEVTFITTAELEDRWPDLSPEQRELKFAREHGDSLLYAASAGTLQERQAARRPRAGLRRLVPQRRPGLLWHKALDTRVWKFPPWAFAWIPPR